MATTHAPRKLSFLLRINDSCFASTILMGWHRQSIYWAALSLWPVTPPNLYIFEHYSLGSPGKYQCLVLY